MSRDHGRWRYDALVLAMGIALLLPYLGAQDLWAPDEPRYAQVAEELRSFEHGPSGLVVLHLNGEAYTQKPPLYYWLAAGLGAALGGVNETAARLPSALAGIATAFLAWRFGSRLFGNTAGVWSAAVLLSVFRFAHTARRVQLDVVLTFLTMLALSAFWQLDRSLGPRTRNLVLLHGALGLAVLTKGPVGLLPIAVIVAYLAWERRLREIRRLLPPAALLFSLGPGLIWISAAVALSPPGFFGDAVTENLLGRFFAGTAHARSPLYYLYQFPADFAPWSLFWPWVGVCAWRALTRAETGNNGPNGPSTGSASAWRFALAWVGTLLVFFSVSAGKRGLYLLPAFPAVALMCGATLDALLAGRNALPRTGAIVFGVGLLALATGGAALLAAGGFESALAPGFALPAAFGWSAVAIASLAALGALLLARRGSSAHTHAALATAALLGFEAMIFWQLYPAFDAEKSPRPIAEAAAKLCARDQAIAIFDHRAMVGGIAYYGQRPVVELASADDARQFLAANGCAIVVRGDKLQRLRGGGAVEVHATVRSGARKVYVVAPPRGGISP